MARDTRSAKRLLIEYAHAVITQLRPRLAILTEFCGGIARRINLGDVAMFTSTAAWDYGKWEEGADGKALKFLARPDALNVPIGTAAKAVRALSEQGRVFDDATNATAREMLGALDRDPGVKAVAAGSGSAIVTSEIVLSRIVDLNENIHAIDMESYGLYHACLHT